MTFGPFRRDEEEAPVSQLLFVPELLSAPSAIVLPLGKNLCVSLLALMSLFSFCSNTLQLSSSTIISASLGGTGPFLGPKAGGHLYSVLTAPSFLS